MARAGEYQKLPGTGRGLAAYYRLYLGTDHLLQVESHGYSEKYSRFRFEEVKAIQLRHTMRRFVYNWILGVGALLAAAPLLAGATEAGIVVFIVFGTPLLLLALANTFKGPICSTYLMSETQRTKLPSLSRLPRARRVLTQIEPLIRSAQRGRSPATTAPAATSDSGPGATAAL